MEILLEHLTPVPLLGSYEHQSGVWNKNTRFIRGKKYLVTAPSGTGKSTLLHTIYGIRKDYQGTLRIDGSDALEFSMNKWAEIRQSGLSVVFQDLKLFTHRTALENILLKARLTQRDEEDEIRNMAERLGIVNLLDKKVETLSYGERQRTAIIRAMCQPFQFILLDEPFSHLDKDNIRKAADLILEKTEENSAGLILASLGEDYGLNYDEKLTV